jgi:hypothetical protein
MLDPRDSTTYQAILRDGRIGGGQRILIRLGTKTLGKCDSATLCVQSKRFEISTCSPSCVSEFLTRRCATGENYFKPPDPTRSTGEDKKWSIHKLLFQKS